MFHGDWDGGDKYEERSPGRGDGWGCHLDNTFCQRKGISFALYQYSGNCPYIGVSFTLLVLHVHADLNTNMQITIVNHASIVLKASRLTNCPNFGPKSIT